MSTISKISITENQLIINYKGPPQPQRYRGVNLSAYDEGTMAGGSINNQNPALCTDGGSIGSGDNGGWISYPKSFPLYEDEKAKKPYNLDTHGLAATFSVGNSGSHSRITRGFKGSPLAPISLNPQENSIWTTSYPQVNQINLAMKAGVNIFRLPFMPTFVTDLATGWAMRGIPQDKGHPYEKNLYAQGNPMYFNYYMTTLDYIVNNGGIVILDNHVYQRWCPMNIPGTYSCLEPAGGWEPPVPDRNYSMDKITDMGCPYALDQKGLSYFKSKGIKSEWGGSMEYIKGNDESNNGITVDNIKKDFCLNVTNKFSSSTNTEMKSFNSGTKANCTSNSKGSKGNACYGGPTKRILGVDCTTILWYNILNLEFQLIDESGKASAKKRVLDYVKGNSNVWLGLMNEPNQVNTRVLGQTYGKVINMIRGLGVRNTLLVEGNYWAGLHAQIDPSGGKADGVTRKDASTQGWTWPEDTIKVTPNKGNNFKGAPAEIIYQEIKKANGNNMKSVGDWKYDVHQYMDLNSTGNFGCIGQNENGVRDLKGMRFFTNIEPFEEWCKWRGVRAICTEFGVQNGNKALNKGGSDPGCKYKLNLFLEMLEKSPAFDGWTIWRNPAAVSFAAPYHLSGSLKANGTYYCEESCLKAISWTNSVMWQPSDQNAKAIFEKGDPNKVTPPFAEQKSWGYEFPIYKNLYQCTKPFTDPKSQEYCMPYLWALNGDSTKSADGQEALQKCIKYGTKGYELEVEEEGYY